MNAKPLISIVIPIYNVENYLEKCVDSVINQTYKNLQIILVDDGSKDNSPSMCDSYKEKDERIEVIHKENGGLSDARNVGMKSVKGDYVFFLDSDDWIEINAIEKLYELLTFKNADITISNYYYTYEDRNDIANKLDNNFVFEKEEAMKELLSNNIIKNFAWGKLFKTELLKGYEFPKGKLFEDVYWTHLIFDQCNRVALSKDPLVYYLQRSNSISYSFNEKKIHLIEGYLERRQFVKDKYPQFLNIVDNILVDLILNIYIESIRSKNAIKYNEFRKRLLFVAKELLDQFDQNTDKQISNRLNVLVSSPNKYMLKRIKDKLFK